MPDHFSLVHIALGEYHCYLLLAQIVILDAIFSVDSIITSVGINAVVELIVAAVVTGAAGVALKKARLID